jgi:ankyrin repeat protein
MYDDLRVLEFLLDNGAEIDAADNEDKTPLMWGNFEEKKVGVLIKLFKSFSF